MSKQLQWKIILPLLICGYYISKLFFHYYKYTLKKIDYTTKYKYLNECKVGDLILYSHTQRLFDRFTKTMMNANFNHVGIYAGESQILHLTYNDGPCIDYIRAQTSVSLYIRPIRGTLKKNDIIKCFNRFKKERMNKKYISFWFKERILKDVDKKFLTCAMFAKKCYILMGLNDDEFKKVKITMPDDFADGLDNYFLPLTSLII